MRIVDVGRRLKTQTEFFYNFRYSKQEHTHTVYTRATGTGGEQSGLLSLLPDARCLSRKILHVSCNNLREYGAFFCLLLHPRVPGLGSRNRVDVLQRTLTHAKPTSTVLLSIPFVTTSFHRSLGLPPALFPLTATLSLIPPVRCRSSIGRLQNKQVNSRTK